MVSEKPTMPGLSTDPAIVTGSQSDPVRVAVQVALVVYLLPVILLVAAIGVLAIAAGPLAKMASKVWAVLVPGNDRLVPRSFIYQERLIGSRPITQDKRKRSRAIR